MGWSARFADGRHDRFHNAVWIGDDLIVPEAKDAPAEALKKTRSIGVIGGVEMLAAVELDRDAGGATGKVEDVVADDQLAGKSRTVVADTVPDEALGLGRMGAEIAGAFGQV